ncbi:MAG: isochorismatase family protein [Chloroflexota bacterium]|nr:isochorismatase family protein [Chloroflexota bacterium]
MAVWDDIFSGEDKEVYERAGYARKMGFGKKPGLLIVDITYPFVGEKKPVLESVKRFPQSAGEYGWKAVENVAKLLPIARSKKLPIFYVDRQYNRVIRKFSQDSAEAPEMGQKERGHNIVKEIAPIKGEVIIYKEGASAFFGTNLMSLLNPLGLDTLLICGGTTSGCVRSTVVDAAQYSFYVGIIADCCYDRIQLSHKASLFDMNRYGDVISLEEALEYISAV